MSKEIIQFDQAMFESKLDRMVREKVEQIVNRMLDAEADEIANASRYERTGGRKAYRAGHYDRRVTAKAGSLNLRIPKLKGEAFRSQVVERYRRRESSVEEALMEMYMAGVSTRRVDGRHRPTAVGRADALADVERQVYSVKSRWTLRGGDVFLDSLGAEEVVVREVFQGAARPGGGFVH